MILSFLKRLLEVPPVPGYAYDAAHLLGWSDAPALLPEPCAGECVLFCDVMSLQNLRATPLGASRLLWGYPWLYDRRWATTTQSGGIYRLRFPVTSRGRQFAFQRAHLPEGHEPASVVVAAAAALLHRVLTGEDLFHTARVRCREAESIAGVPGHVTLHWHEGQLLVSLIPDHAWDASLGMLTMTRDPSYDSAA